MEIVRQRKKRLLAWILTLVLCVGMWQGSVQAEGEDGGDGALTSPEVMSTEVPPTEAEPTDGGDESANPVVASETGDGVMPVADKVLIGYSDNMAPISDASFERIIEGAETDTSEDGSISIKVSDSSTSFSVYAYTNGYGHELIEWKLAGSGIEQGGTGNTVSRGDKYGWNQFINGLEVTWGKILVVKDGESNLLGVCFQRSNDSDAEPVSIELSPINLCQKGYFFSGWSADNGVGSIDENKFTANLGLLDMMYVETTVTAIYDSLTVPSGGSFELIDSLGYQLGEGTWDVGDDYSYSGNQTFYVPENNTYSFKLQEQ